MLKVALGVAEFCDVLEFCIFVFGFVKGQVGFYLNIKYESDNERVVGKNYDKKRACEGIV